MELSINICGTIIGSGAGYQSVSESLEFSGSETSWPHGADKNETRLYLSSTHLIQSPSPRTQEPSDARETGSLVPLRRGVVKYGQLVPVGLRRPTLSALAPGHGRRRVPLSITAGMSRATAECSDMSKQSEIHHVSAGVTLLMDSGLLQSVKERALFVFSQWDRPTRAERI